MVQVTPDFVRSGDLLGKQAVRVGKKRRGRPHHAGVLKVMKEAPIDLAHALVRKEHGVNGTTRTGFEVLVIGFLLMAGEFLVVDKRELRSAEGGLRGGGSGGGRASLPLNLTILRDDDRR